MKNYEYEYEYCWLIVSKIRLFRDITAKIEMSKFRFDVIFANNFLRKRKRKKEKRRMRETLLPNGQLRLLRSHQPYESRPLQRRLTVPIVILVLEEENQLAIIACAISLRISRQ